jgi:phosphotransferase system HPr-like phosphotransfer protein
MLLAASQGTELTLRVQGEDAQQAHADVCNIINNRFDEDE